MTPNRAIIILSIELSDIRISIAYGRSFKIILRYAKIIVAPAY